MRNLPSDILHIIFLQLPLKERLTCTLVCRYWYNYLNENILLYDIHIQKDEILYKFICMLQRLPGRGSQVEIFKLKTGPTFDRRQFCNMLPNVRVFEYVNSSGNHRNQKHCNHSIELQHPISKLKSITEEDQCELTRHLLKFGSCPRLRDLKLNLQYTNHPRKNIFTHLKTATALKTLTLTFCRMGIAEVEIIHNNVPTLETLDLPKMKLITSISPKSIIPATSVTTLKIYMLEVEDNPIHLEWYTYLGKKYVNLTHFQYFDSTLLDFNLLKTMKAYRDGLFPLLRVFNASIPTYFFMDIPVELNPFATLDGFGIGISELLLEFNDTRPIFEQLAISNQSKYIEYLGLTHTAIGSPMMLQYFTSLRELSIEKESRYCKWNINLTDFFNAFPPTLTLFDACIKDANITELPTRPNNIQILTLKCDILYPKLGDTISHCCPQLRELTLQGYAPENISILVPNNHFKRLCIEIECSGDPTHAYSIIDRSDHKYYWKSDKNKPLTLTTFEEICNRVIITLHYASTTFLVCDKIDINK